MIWQALATPGTLDEILAAVAAAFGADPASTRADVEAFLVDLASRGFTLLME